jgi:hypothetical protein
MTTFLNRETCNGHPWPAAFAAALGHGEIPDELWNALFPTPCPRFGRMDALCRLSLMAVELLDKSFPEDTGVILQTHTGCLATDRKFLQTLSPSVFTYTLPSTAIGEICIRHKLRGPVLCFLTATPDEQLALPEAQAWLREGKVTGCLCLAADAASLEATATYCSP